MKRRKTSTSDSLAPTSPQLALRQAVIWIPAHIRQPSETVPQDIHRRDRLICSLCRESTALDCFPTRLFCLFSCLSWQVVARHLKSSNFLYPRLLGAASAIPDRGSCLCPKLQFPSSPPPSFQRCGGAGAGEPSLRVDNTDGGRTGSAEIPWLSQPKRGSLLNCPPVLAGSSLP
jgi:hypothetical protein